MMGWADGWPGGVTSWSLCPPWSCVGVGGGEGASIKGCRKPDPHYS